MSGWGTRGGLACGFPGTVRYGFGPGFLAFSSGFLVRFEARVVFGCLFRPAGAGDGAGGGFGDRPVGFRQQAGVRVRP
ncbi:hypothetical protein [Streptomyces sp. YGL11-2]|uniref:hypothetical protein n=1 Tax=Streptomyces sp. YGL11-2 TaxID=3414028 RepID=UPI003CE9EFA1